MTELEKIAYAKSFMDKLAEGINPIDGTPVPEGDTVNNPRLLKCFAYVSDILSQVCENGGIKKRGRVSKAPFSVTLEQLEKFEYSDEPIPASEIVRRISAITAGENMKRITARHIKAFLLDCGVLKDGSGKSSFKRPTEYGAELGITVESRNGPNGDYQLVLYSREAQKFIIDNIEAVAEMQIRPEKKAE